MSIGYMVIKVSFKGGIARLKKGSHSVRLHRRKSSLKLVWSLEVVRRLSIVFYLICLRL